MWKGSLAGVVVVALLQACNGSGCREGGKTYEDGDRWICEDGCNHCACDNGVLSSTNKGCGLGGSGGSANATGRDAETDDGDGGGVTVDSG